MLRGSGLPGLWPFRWGGNMFWERIGTEAEDFRSPGQDFLNSEVSEFRMLFVRRELVCWSYKERILLRIDRSRSYISAFRVR